MKVPPRPSLVNPTRCPGILYDVEGHPLKITLKAHLLCAELSGEDHTRRLAWIEQERQRIRVLFQGLRQRRVLV